MAQPVSNIRARCCGRLTSDARTGGAIFLFNRKTVRFFRKDGHSWRKKSDGKTVRETHEKLKARTINFLLLYA